MDFFINLLYTHGRTDMSRDRFDDIHGDYAPPALPAWSTALMSINERSEHATASFPEPVTETYMFPGPALITNVNPIRQKAYLQQLDHCLDALKFRATAIGSDAVPLRPQQWRDVLALSLKRADGNTSSSKSTPSPSIKAFEAAEKMLGLCMQGQGVQVQLVPPSSSPDEQPFNFLRGRQLIWELCELNFRYELLALDHRVFCAAEVPIEVTTATGAINDSNSDRQNAILAVFSGNSLIPPAEGGAEGGLLDDDGFSGKWEKRRERLCNLRDLMRSWSVPLPVECKGLMGPTETEGGLAVEKALAMHYAQTFFDFFGRPPVLPRRKPAADNHIE